MVNRVIETGTIGVTPGFQWSVINPLDDIPSSNDIDGDNDGEMSPTHAFVIDLSQIASRKLGKQCSMMQEYKVRSVRIGIRHENDTDDNDDNDAFAGYLYMYPPTDHLKNGLQLAREVEKVDEADEIDNDSFLLSTQRDYVGFRYGWGRNHTVEYQTTASQAMQIDWTLEEIGEVYSTMADRPEQDNALWSQRWPSLNVSQWHCKAASGYETIEEDPSIPTDFTDDTLVLNYTTIPLIAGRVVWAGVKSDNLLNDDDYTLHVTVDFELGGVF